MAIRANVISSIVFIVFAIGCMILSWSLPFGTPLEPMPGFVPFAVSVVLLLASVIHLVVALRGRGESVDVDTVGEMWRRPAQVVVGLLLYSLVLDWLGYIVATTALALLVMRVFEPDAWLKPLAIAIFVSGASYVLFDRLLEVNLPGGILEGIL